jgi:L-ascorbate metabolism protein UlaG (beta-lactamase superfamily)
VEDDGVDESNSEQKATGYGEPERLIIQVVGGPTAVLQYGGVRLLTDPTFSPAGVHESAPGRTLTKTEDPAIGVGAVGPIDVVLLSHDQHADNLDPAGREVLGTVPLTLTTEAAADRLGGTARGLRRWQRVSVPGPAGGGIEVIGVPARHGPVGCEPVTGEVTGFVLRGDDLPTVYVSGDNAAIELVRDIAEQIGTVDVALLFAGAARTSLFDGAPLTLTSADAATAARLLDARWVVPVHVQGWAHFSEGPDEVRAAFSAAGLTDRLRFLAPGEHAVFS